MSLVLFHQTLLVLLVSILVASTCLSAYLVSRRKILLYAFVGFLFYFFDIAYVFQDEYHMLIGGDPGLYLVIRSLVVVVTGAGSLTALWWALCEKLGVSSRRLRIVPAVVFVVASFAMLTLPEGGMQRFLFYSVRAAYGLWMLAYLVYAYFTTKNEMVRSVVSQRWLFFGALLLLDLAVIAEDWACFIVIDASFIELGPITLSTERNYAEEAAMLVVAFVAFRGASRTLALRFERPPHGGVVRQSENFDDILRQYSYEHSLSDRERQVLVMVLEGKDNQNIASELSLALSTVKVHVHNILQKTKNANRQELIQDVWRLM
ncbi:helix-turn-helix transcriptional regulator [Eggerthellaceae bacterium zg-887]|uniref:helix-turn-helix transcriptional regulator n=1 Tax=Xiamenia xianingshaonis TaxID=2682776 RepID=UPI00140B04B8|nr:helix-turn-helix transcriptional regulator [Xiamenia xianingshaonis]NHM17007.1 helix-turn-helix transcriptional regulator [Xiamenia xianingshaonis]